MYCQNVIKQLPSVLTELGHTFNDAGFQIYLVGGAVRNKFMHRKLSDFDLTTDAHPQDVQKLFRRVIPTGIKHGTVTVLYKGYEFEITTFRIESDYSNQRHPDKVSFSADIKEDLKRRDFTINAIALNLVTNEIIDPHNGRTDLKKKIIRCIGIPEERFNEDGLRLMRAVRFMSQLDFKIESKTYSGIKECSKNLEKVSKERIRDELIKILLSKEPSKAFFVMEETKLLKNVIPELSECRGVQQKSIHKYDVFDHLLYACDGAPAESLTLRMAALLHDIGKPKSLAFDDDGLPTFYRHEIYSAQISRTILKRLKFPVKTENQIIHLIENHMFNYQEEWTDAAVRRFIATTGKEYIDDLFLLRKADQFGMTGQKIDSLNLKLFRTHINAVLAEEHTFKIKDLKLNGNLIHNKIGVPKGPLMGVVLDFLLEAVFDDPKLNTEEKLLEMAANFYKNRIDLNK